MSINLSVEDVPFNRFHKLLTVRSVGGLFVDGYVLSIIGVALATLSPQLGLDAFWQGMIAASALLGIFVGGFIGGMLTDRLGRRLLYFVGPAMFVIFSIAQFWVTSGTELFALRFMIGIAVGIEYPVATAFLVEFLPKKQRGPCLASLNVLWFAGAATAFMVAETLLHFGGENGWRWTLASTAVIGAMLFLVRLGTPESPRWLMSKGREKEAETIIQRVYGANFGLAHLAENREGKKLRLNDLLHSGYGKRMAFVAIFWTCSVTPVFAVYAFAPRVLDALHLSGDWAAWGSIAITLLFVIGCVVAMRQVNTLGRRKLLIRSFLWSGLALLLLGWMNNGPSLLILALFGAYALCIGGAQVLQFVYPNEIFPTEIRAGAVGFTASLSRIGAAAGTWLVPLSLQNAGIEATMYIAAAITFTGLLVSWLMAPETKNLTLTEAASLQEDVRVSAPRQPIFTERPSKVMNTQR
ncbi:MFS transporter [Klebsiella pneumoniae]|uniref:MFS transporter n=1 Tax=Klebsiella pneumoniae TaxID=573 RepID=UPI00115BE3FF|nr:MFS transporter [Klebsiella pneumoniae]